LFQRHLPLDLVDDLSHTALRIARAAQDLPGATPETNDARGRFRHRTTRRSHRGGSRRV
jgi:hypothetical protein